ncbi:MAG: alpha amylase C-terminal domain-containing protein [Candidatus Eisenbacteria bacterium]|nr:alpha amylase C-terminal domain-containing protein [Candidatus Eisenbacteria bacterium]
MRLTLGALLLTPGVPALLMGDEWLETAAWGTAAHNRIDWSNREAHPGHFAFVRDLVDLRINTPALHADAASVPTHGNYVDGVFSWIRHDALGRLFLVIVNLGENDFPSYLMGAPAAGEWFERLNSQAAAYGGTGAANDTALTAFVRAQDGYPRSLDIRLPRSSVLVLQARNTLGVEPDAVGAAGGIESVWPNPARGTVRVAFALPRSGEAELSVFDTQGRRVALLHHGMLAAGPREMEWNGRNDSGAPAPAGVYLVRLRSSEGTSIRRVARVR